MHSSYCVSCSFSPLSCRTNMPKTKNWSLPITWWLACNLQPDVVGGKSQPMSYSPLATTRQRSFQYVKCFCACECVYQPRVLAWFEPSIRSCLYAWRRPLPMFSWALYICVSTDEPPTHEQQQWREAAANWISEKSKRTGDEGRFTLSLRNKMSEEKAKERPRDRWMLNKGRLLPLQLTSSE